MGIQERGVGGEAARSTAHTCSACLKPAAEKPVVLFHVTDNASTSMPMRQPGPAAVAHQLPRSACRHQFPHISKGWHHFQVHGFEALATQPAAPWLLQAKSARRCLRTDSTKALIMSIYRAFIMYREWNGLKCLISVLEPVHHLTHLVLECLLVPCQAARPKTHNTPWIH